MQDVNLHKQNSLIEITPKNLTSAQRKGFNAFLKIAKKELKVNEKFDQLHDSFKITVKEVKKLTGIEGGNKKVFNYLKGLKDKEIIKYQNEKNWEIISIIQSISRIEGDIYFSLSNYVYNRLVEAEYTTLDLCEMGKLNGKYAITLYEWFLRYKNFKPNGEYYNPKYSLEDFREKVGSTGKSYENIKELKRSVIDPAIRELNTKTDLKVSYELTREGSRKYTHIQLVLERSKILESDTILDIQICETTQGVIDKILKTDLIHIDGKRVKRNELEEAIKDLNKQHKKPDLIIKGLKKLVRENKKTVNPTSLKGYIWTIAKSILEEDSQVSKEIKVVELKEEEPMVTAKETTEPINLNDYTEEQIEKAIEKCSKNEDMTIKLLKSMLKKSERAFKATIKKYLPSLSKEDQVKIDPTGVEKEKIEQHKDGLKQLIMSKLNSKKINLELYGKLIKKITNIKNNEEFNSVMLEIVEID